VDLLKQEVGAWSQVWLRHPGAKAPWREEGCTVGPALPPLTPQILREAAGRFPAHKGYHGFCARWFLYLGDEALECICQLLMACERLGFWPETLQHALLHLIPKRGGGKRPIGLINGLCRLWEIARRSCVREWRAANWRKYDYGGKGRTSTDAVWLQSLYDEAMEASGLAAATMLLDLMKAFESVPLEHVWACGLRLGFPLGILRLSLEVCAFARHLTLEGVTAQGVYSLSAIMAGTSFATDLLFAVMIAPCDSLLEVWPSLNLSLVVDDLAVQAVGEKDDVPTIMLEASAAVIEDLAAMGCMVSKGERWLPGGKTVVTGTSPPGNGATPVRV